MNQGLSATVCVCACALAYVEIHMRTHRHINFLPVYTWNWFQLFNPSHDQRPSGRRLVGKSLMLSHFRFSGTFYPVGTHRNPKLSWSTCHNSCIKKLIISYAIKIISLCQFKLPRYCTCRELILNLTADLLILRKLQNSSHVPKPCQRSSRSHLPHTILSYWP